MEPCKHDRDIGGMNTVLKGLVKEIYGNGQAGLSKTVPAMNKTLDVLVQETAELKVAVSGVLKFIAETTGYEDGCREAREKQENKMAALRQKTTIALSLLVGLFTILVMLIAIYS